MRIITTEDSDHSVLLQPAKRVDFPCDDDTKNFISDFKAFFTQLDSVKGAAGLAATQVGMSLQMFIVQAGKDYGKYRKNVYDYLEPTLFINPHYEPVIEDGEHKDWEGCFSIPSHVAQVYRYNTIEVFWCDEQGQPHQRIVRGYLARVIQHESGHLTGEIFTELARDDCRVMTYEEYYAMRRAAVGSSS